MGLSSHLDLLWVRMMMLPWRAEHGQDGVAVAQGGQAIVAPCPSLGGSVFLGEGGSSAELPRALKSLPSS